MEDVLFKLVDESTKTYKIIPCQYPVDIYVSLSDTNSFAHNNGSLSNTLYKPKQEVKLETDLCGFVQSCFIDGYFSTIINIGVYGSYFSKIEDGTEKNKSILGIVVHEITHVVGDLYTRIEETFKGNEHDAYLISYLFNRITEIIEYDFSLENK